MRNRGLRGHIAESNFTLLAAAIVATALWVAGGGTGTTGLAGLLLTGVTAYALVELNNANALLRIRSRMVSATYLVLMGALAPLHAYTPQMWVPLLVLAAYHLLFRTYQSHSAEVCAFHAFLCIALCATIFPHILFFVPFYWLAMIVQLRSFSPRTFMASLLGLALPLFLLEAANFYLTRPLSAPRLWHLLGQFPHPQYSALTEQQLVNLGTVCFLAIAAILHFRHTKFNDKIRTRMFFYVLIVQEWLIAGFLIAQPQHYEPLFRLLILNSTPLVAHHLALTEGRWGTVYFYFSVTLLLALTVYNLWGPFPLFS